MKWGRILGGGSREDALGNLRSRIAAFRDLLEKNNRVLETIGDATEKLGGDYLFDSQYLRSLDSELAIAVAAVVADLGVIAPKRHADLKRSFDQIREAIRARLESRPTPRGGPFVLRMDQVGSEQAWLVGEKLARLGEIRTRLGVRVPAGFVITATAYERSFANARLAELLARAQLPGADLVESATLLGEAISSASLPSGPLHALKRALRGFDRRARFAVRSSALGEDDRLSFAGVHRSILNVPRNQVTDAWVRVVASLFDERALRYRREHQEPLDQAAMAVGCLLLVPARASGVMYTVDPADPERNVVLVDAAWGLGRTVVEGSGAVDRFSIERGASPRIVGRRIGAKSHQWVAAEGAGLERVEVDPEFVQQPAVGDETLLQLAKIGLAIERHMRCPQDIEWAVDGHGDVWILQARALRVRPVPKERAQRLIQVLAEHPRLMANRGVIACRGIGAGKVVVPREGAGMESFPAGSVLVARYPSPRLARFIPVASAIVTDAGASTGHLATLARERRVPAIMGTGIATEVLRPGAEITVDAEENVIYDGRVPQLTHFGLLQPDDYCDTKEFRVLRAMLAHIAPLALRDPTAPEFTAKACRSYHDIIRYAHEMALTELSNPGGFGLGKLSRRGEHTWELDLEIPLDLLVIDIGGGVRGGRKKRRIAPSALTCRPLSRVLEALARPGVWARAPAGMDLAGFMASATRSMTLTAPAAGIPQRNLAIVSDRYMNLSLKLGYHFNVVDAYLGNSRENSHVLFRFVGGVTELVRRTRRAKLLSEILAHYDFSVTRSGDLVLARLVSATPALVEERLLMVGRLIGFSRQLDILLHDDDTADRLLADFIAGAPQPLRPGTET